MIPPFDAEGLLPAGIHEATWDELATRFGGSERRRTLLDGLYRALCSLRDAGCWRVYVDGSFVTSKAEPADYDACWEPAGVDYRRIDPVLFDFERERRAQKRAYLGERFPSTFLASPNKRTFLEVFQLERETVRPKGIVAVDLKEWK